MLIDSARAGGTNMTMNHLPANASLAPSHGTPTATVRATILVVEDDETLADLLRSVLEQERYLVSVAISAFQAKSMIAKSQPDLLILDRGLPDADGIEVCQELRAVPETRGLPILFLTVRKGIADRVLGLRMGGDDYLPKPFLPDELVARVAALLRRSRGPLGEEPALIVHGPIRLNADSRIAHLGEQELDLTQTQFNLLVAFLERPDRVLSRTFLLSHIWGYRAELEMTTKAVDMMVVSLRRKLGQRGTWIETVRGFGYRFRSEH